MFAFFKLSSRTKEQEIKKKICINTLTNKIAKGRNPLRENNNKNLHKSFKTYLAQ